MTNSTLTPSAKAYVDAVQNKCKTLGQVGKSKWNTLREALETTANNEGKRWKWATDEIPDQMKKRQKEMVQMMLDKSIRNKCKETK